jgi:tetratricopeptide (TPR) repeat protein
MKRTLLRLLAAGCVAVLAAGPAVAQDEIRYYDRAKKKEDTAKGKITEESPAQIVYKLTSRTEQVPAADVIDVTYEIRPANRPLYRSATNNDEKLDKPGTEEELAKAFQESLKAYRELLAEFKDNPLAERHMRFRLARLLARRAEQDPAQAEPAVAEMSKFLKENPNGWQVGQAGKTLGRLQEDKGDVAAAQKTYEGLAARPELPKETRLEFEILSARALIHTNKHAAATEKLTKMAKDLPPGDPQAQKVQVYLAECQVAAKNYAEAEAKLKEVLAGSADNSVKGLAYNTLGDCYRENGKPEEALWQYLWVDVVYNQDRQEQAKALYYLAKLFDQVKNDPAKALQCRERLLKEFAGADYQKRALKEEKGEEK